MPLNTFNQEVGEALPDFTSGNLPNITILKGNYCTLEHIDAIKHLNDIADFYWKNAVESDWTYFFDEPYTSLESVRKCLKEYESSSDPYFFAIRDKESSRVLGTIALMSIKPNFRSIEMGCVMYSSKLQRTRAATEAQYLVMSYVFEKLGYRRYEWKCDSLNLPSARAAKRLGFQYEGRFRNAVVYKGRSRDTDWFSIIDSEWQTKKLRLESWLSPRNFDDKGNQKKALKDC